MKNEKPENKGEIESTIEGLIEYFDMNFGKLKDKEPSVYVEEISSPKSVLKVFKIVLGYTTVDIPIPSYVDPTTIDESDYDKREQFSFVWNTDKTMVNLIEEVDKCFEFISQVKIKRQND
jgi:hypothetical protein